MKLFSPHKARQGGERAGVERRKENIFTSNRIELLENSIWDFLCMSREEKRHLLELFFIQRHESFMTVIFDAFFTAAENDFLGCVSFRLAYVGMNARQKGVVRLFSFSPLLCVSVFLRGRKRTIRVYQEPFNREHLCIESHELTMPRLRISLAYQTTAELPEKNRF
jgi:hypothetical protein